VIGEGEGRPTDLGRIRHVALDMDGTLQQFPATRV